MGSGMKDSETGREKKPVKKHSLRRRAEELLAEKGFPLPLLPGDMTELVRELAVNHIELELQNEELKRVQGQMGLYIEELRKTEKELEKSRDSYAELYDYAPTAYFTVEVSKGSIVTANLTAADLLRSTKGSLYTSKLAPFIDPEYADVLQISSQKAQCKPHKEICELKMRRADGSTFWALVEVRGMPESEQVRLSVTDISERKKIEQMKDDFIGMVSHELRTPLTVLMGSFQVAQSEGISPQERKELLEEVARSSENLASILENLIELSRYNSGRLRLAREHINIESLIHNVLRYRAGHLSKHQVRLDIAESLPEVEADEIRLRQILNNLLDNAAKYSSVNTEIRITVRQEDEHLLIGISDRGKGIPPGDREKLFAPFERLRENSTTKPGLGLGLLVCKRLVEVRGGKIWAESEPGKGSTFWFTLPLSPTPHN